MSAAEKKKARKKLIILCGLCGFFAVLLTVLILLKKSAAFTEFMVTKVARNIITVMGRVMGLIPFSMFELFLYLAVFAVLGGLVAIIILLFKKRWNRCLRVFMSLALASLIIGNVYFVSAGFSYNRYQEYYPDLDPNINKEQTIVIAEYFINDFNALAESLPRDKKGTVIPPYSNDELSYRLQQEYFRLSGYDINPYTPKCKTVLSSGLMSEMHITGVFFAPFGEPNVNALTPPSEMPFTMAHEMAHAKGIMLEDDADKTALYITLTSDDPYIRYSAYSEAVFSFLTAVEKWEDIEGLAVKTETNRLYNLISPLIWQERKNNSEHWQKYYRLSNIMNKLNDFYLKLMGQKEGTAAYIPDPPGQVEKPMPDPGNTDPVNPGNPGNPIDPVDPPKYVTVPAYNPVQKIFFRAYVESAGALPDKAEESPAN